MAELVRLDDLCLGATNPKKVIHHEHCPHAKMPYEWARRFDSVADMGDEMNETGAWRWHRFCQSCCGDLEDAINRWLRSQEPWTAPVFFDPSVTSVEA